MEYEEDPYKWVNKALYMQQYIGQYVGTTCNRSYRRLAYVTKSACYFSHDPSNWAHISNCFLYLKRVSDLNEYEIVQLFNTIYPNHTVPVCNIVQMCNEVFLKLKYEFWHDNLYTPAVHDKCLELGLATPTFIGSPSREKISLADLETLNYIASREMINQFNKFYRELTPNSPQEDRLWPTA